MKAPKFAEAQIAFILKQANEGMADSDLDRFVIYDARVACYLNTEN